MKTSILALCVLGLVCAVFAHEESLCQPQAGQVYAGLYGDNGGSRFSGEAVYITFSDDERFSVTETSLDPTEETLFIEWHIDGGELAVRDFASYPSGLNCDPDLVGVYKTEYTENCFELTLSLVEDPCTERAVLYDGLTVRNARKLAPNLCAFYPNQLYTGHYPVSQNNDFSQFPVTFTFSQDGSSNIEHSEGNTYFNHWETTSDTLKATRLASNPEAGICEVDTVGEYRIRYALDCTYLTLEVESDECDRRVEEYNGIILYRVEDFEIINGASSVSVGLFAVFALVFAFLF